MDAERAAASYEIEGRELIAQAPGLRVQVLSLGPGQCVPWHHHTAVTDTFFCLEGPMVVETRAPETSVRLATGELSLIHISEPTRPY